MEAAPVPSLPLPVAKGPKLGLYGEAGLERVEVGVGRALGAVDIHFLALDESGFVTVAVDR